MVLTDITGLGTSDSVTSKARVLPLLGSGERNAMRGVESHRSISQAWPIHRTCATSSCALG